MYQHYQLVKPRLNLRPSTTAHVDYAKYLLRILVLSKFVRASNGIYTNAYSFFFKKKKIKENLEHLDFLNNHTQEIYNPHAKKIVIASTKKFYKILRNM